MLANVPQYLPDIAGAGGQPAGGDDRNRGQDGRYRS